MHRTASPNTIIPNAIHKDNLNFEFTLCEPAVSVAVDCRELVVLNSAWSKHREANCGDSKHKSGQIFCTVQISD